MWINLTSGVRGIAYHSFIYGALSVLGFIILPFLHFSERFRVFFTSYCFPILVRIILFLSGTRVDVEGKDNLAQLKNDSYIIIANHVTSLDISVLTKGLNIADLRYVYSGNVFASIPVVGNHACRVFRGLGWYEVANEDIMVLRRLSKRIRAQMATGKKMRIMIFPEGTRSWEGNVDNFQPGAFYLAYLLKLPIVPVVLRGIYACHRPAQLRVFAGRVRMRILPPLSAPHRGEEARRWTERTRKSAQDIYHSIGSLNISA